MNNWRTSIDDPIKSKHNRWQKRNQKSDKNLVFDAVLLHPNSLLFLCSQTCSVRGLLTKKMLHRVPKNLQSAPFKVDVISKNQPITIFWIWRELQTKLRGIGRGGYVKTLFNQNSSFTVAFLLFTDKLAASIVMDVDVFFLYRMIYFASTVVILQLPFNTIWKLVLQLTRTQRG